MPHVGFCILVALFTVNCATDTTTEDLCTELRYVWTVEYTHNGKDFCPDLPSETLDLRDTDRYVPYPYTEIWCQAIYEPGSDRRWLTHESTIIGTDDHLTYTRSGRHHPGADLTWTDNGQFYNCNDYPFVMTRQAPLPEQ